MAASKDIKKKAYEVLNRYGLTSPTLDELVFIVQSLGFEIIDFDKESLNESTRTLLEELDLTELAKSSKAFVYQRVDIQLLFIDENLSAEEKRYAIAHELGHIVCGHLRQYTTGGMEMQEEFEANEFVHYLLQPGYDHRIGSIFRKRLNESSRGGLVMIMIALLAATGVLVILNVRQYEADAATEEPLVMGQTEAGMITSDTAEAVAEETDIDPTHSDEIGFTMKDLDPFGYIGKGEVFGTNIDGFIDGLEEDKDYTITDIYKDQSVYAYALFKQPYEYFGIEEGNTGVRVFMEPDEGVTMICYDFMVDSAKPEFIISKLETMMNCIRQVYGRGYDFGIYYDSLDSRKFVNFDAIANGLRAGNNGSYALQWVLDNYAVSLDMNYDRNNSASLGSVRFYKPREE